MLWSMIEAKHNIYRCFIYLACKYRYERLLNVIKRLVAWYILIQWKFWNVISLAVSVDWIKCELSVSIGWFCKAHSNKRQHTVLFSGLLLIFHQFVTVHALFLLYLVSFSICRKNSNMFKMLRPIFSRTQRNTDTFSRF